jgi:putative flippase GtrA
MKDTRLFDVAKQNKPEIKRFGKFAIVGFSGLIVDYTVLNILAHVFNVDSWIAVAVAFVIAATNNFIWNRLWVYPESRVEKKRKLLPLFLGINAVGLLINELILFLLESTMTAFFHSAFLGLNVTKAIAAIVVLFWNFFVNRLVTFRNVKWQTADAGQAIAPEAVESAL